LLGEEDVAQGCRWKSKADKGRKQALLGVAVCVLLLFAACSQTAYHEVRRGETLRGISRKYGVSSQELARHNSLRNSSKLEVGQKLRIPPGQSQKVAAAAKPFSSSAGASTLTEKRGDNSAPLFTSRRTDGSAFLRWPVEGPITSVFGPRNGSFHDGVDVAAPVGTPVVASADGKVIFSDVLRGYGNVVIVRHANGYLTVYAHNRANRVKEGQTVRQGDVVAEVGQTGRATGASLHFEVRKDNLARDPLRYLPTDRQTARQDGSPSASANEATVR
jgi:murein DD-endopeptidase MepM/ murein hydrolase activator NlpD